MMKTSYAAFFLALNLLFAGSLLHSAQVWIDTTLRWRLAKRTQCYRLLMTFKCLRPAATGWHPYIFNRVFLAAVPARPISSLPSTRAELSLNGQEKRSLAPKPGKISDRDEHQQ